MYKMENKPEKYIPENILYYVQHVMYYVDMCI